MAYQIYKVTSTVYCELIALEQRYTWRSMLIPQNAACLFILLFYFCKGRRQHRHLQVWNKPRWDLSENDTGISDGFPLLSLQVRNRISLKTQSAFKENPQGFVTLCCTASSPKINPNWPYHWADTVQAGGKGGVVLHSDRSFLEKKKELKNVTGISGLFHIW